MTRVFWAAVLAGGFALLWWKIDWLLSLPAAQLGAAEVTAVLLFAVCVVGVVLPDRMAAPVQTLILFFGLFAVAGGVIMAL
ncbi:MAG: hypothetical protein LUG44_03695 [Clostridiales bacterium]|nr:hypothetical protein [Clostridiales bacterium]